MLLIIDNQSTYIKKFKRDFLSEQDFDYIFFDHNQPIILSEKATIDGIILSGGRGTPYQPLNLTTNFIAIMNFKVPILGLCLGHEIIATAYLGRIKKLLEPQNQKEEIFIEVSNDPIFEGINKKSIILQKKHTHYVSALPTNFIRLASSKSCKNEIIKHNEKNIYGFQSHPEVSGPDGNKIIINFLKMCNLKVEE